MSILQNLKILNKPIAELAMLPQEAIIKLAQSGQIPVGFVAPILGEKAEQTKAGAAAAAMMAQQQMPQPTVLEKIMAENAVGEVQSQLPEDVGIGALPVDEGSLPDEFAGGGIVAFQTGNLVQKPSTSQFGGLEDIIKRRQDLYKEFVGANEAAKNELEGMESEAAQQRAMRLIEAGLGIASGESPYFAANLKGALPAIQGYSKDVEAQRKRKAELASAERTERIKLLEGALEDEAKREIAQLGAGKLTDTKYFAELAEKAAKGDESARRQMNAMLQFAQAQAIAGGGPERAEAALRGANVREDEAAQRRHKNALEYRQKALAPGTAGSQEYLRRQIEDREANKKSGAKPGDPNYKNSAEEYREQLYREGFSSEGSSASTETKPKAETKPTAPKPEAGKSAEAKASSIDVGNDMTTARLTGKELRQKIEALGDHPNRKQLEKRLRESETEYKRRIFAEKNPTKVTSQEQFDNLPEGTVYQLPNGDKGIRGGVAQKSISTPTPPSGAKPAAPTSAKPMTTLPPGAKQIGTKGGKPVYELPDGTRVIQQ